jgi:hypothetical protein
MELPEIAGWIGTVCILLAYILLMTDKIEEDDRSYLVLNLVGSLGVGINVFVQHAWPALILQIVWGLIAIGSLIRCFFLLPKKKAASD